MLAGVMIFVDVSIVNVALPSFTTGLGAGPADLSWIVAGYTLTFGLALVPGGRLGDQRGRQRMLDRRASCSSPSRASRRGWRRRRCGSSSPVSSRALAGGLVNPQLLGLIQQMFTGAERGTRLRRLRRASTRPRRRVGPLLGGVLIELRRPAGGLAVGLPRQPAPRARRARPRPPPPARAATARRGRARTSLDPVGAVAPRASPCVGVLLPVVLAERDPAERAVVDRGARAGRRGRLRRLGTPATPGGDATRCSTEPGAAQPRLRPGYAVSARSTWPDSTAIFFVLTVYLQQGLGYSALLAGLATMPYAMGSALAAAWGGRVVGRIGRPLVVVGTVVMAAGISRRPCSSWHCARTRRRGLLTALPLFVSGLGSGLVITPEPGADPAAPSPSDQGGTAGGCSRRRSASGRRSGSPWSPPSSSPSSPPSGQQYGTALAAGLLVVLLCVLAAFAWGSPTSCGAAAGDRRLPSIDDVGTGLALGHRDGPRTPTQPPTAIPTTDHRPCPSRRARS